MLLIKGVRVCIYTILAFSTGVLACVDYEDLPFFKTFNASSMDANELIKRYYTVEPGSGASFVPSTWPQSTIPFCYENANARTQLARIIKSAWDVWQSSGVNYRIDMGEYNECPAAAANGNVPKGPSYLLIRVNSLGIFLTSAGYQTYPAGGGPSLYFDPSPAIGMRDPVANMVHEIGHAWGFFHEQQRPSFWDKSQYAQATGASNQIKFVCQNLADYATQAGVPAGGIDDVCHSQVTAKQNRFSALEYLPMPEPFSAQLDTGEYDWNSVMLYGSQIGGAVANGVPANVYTRASDGMVIGYNKVPSQRDVNRFNAMYSEKAPYKNPCLINQGCSPARALFLNTASKCKTLPP